MTDDTYREPAKASGRYTITVGNDTYEDLGAMTAWRTMNMAETKRLPYEVIDDEGETVASPGKPVAESFKAAIEVSRKQDQTPEGRAERLAAAKAGPVKMS